MKKYLLLLLAACQGMAAMAQSPAYKLKINMKNGTKLSVITDEVEAIKFAKLGKVQAKLSQRYVTSTSLGVNIDIEANASKVKAVCVPASQTIEDPKAYIEANATVEAYNSYKKAFDFLTPETDYVVYALAYDDNGIASEVSSLKLTTGKTADDPFVVNAKNVTTTTLDYVVTPKDDNVQYVVQTTGMDMYNTWCNEGENNGDVFQHFVTFWKAMGNMYGETWQQQIKYDAKKGTYDSEVDYNTQKTLLWDADQVIITFGVTKDGELVTPIQTTKVRTLAPVPSDNKIKLTLKTNAWRDVVITADVSNSDKYIVNVQSAAAADAHIQSGDLVKWLLNSGTDYSNYGKSGSQDWEFSPNKGGQKYYAIGIGIDDNGAPTTEPTIIDFVLPEGGF